MYKVLKIYSNNTVSTICSQFGVWGINKNMKIVIMGIEITSAKIALENFNDFNLSVNNYFHPAMSNAFTASALYFPKSAIEILSSSKVPQEATKFEIFASLITGYS